MLFPFIRQKNNIDCGPTCLAMICKFYGRSVNTATLRSYSRLGKGGVNILGISEAAEKVGLRTLCVELSLEKLIAEAPLPCIVHWDQNHFVVVTPKSTLKTIVVADPARGIVKYSIDQFRESWNGKRTEGIALVLEPTPAFYELAIKKEKKLSWSLVTQYLKAARWQITQIFLALIITSILSLIFPFLTQSIVDNGINTQNLQFVIVILIAQLMLTFSQTIVSFVRNRLLLRVSNILNIQILSDFWIKLTRLPVSYFDVHNTGDTLQRIGDHKTIQTFLTGTALNTIFSFFNFLVYTIVLMIYNVELFFVFCIGSIIYFTWIQFFMRIRRKLNYETFQLSSKENSAILQLIQGMQEIKLNNAEKQKRWEWEHIQANVFKLNFRSLNYSQIQQVGATLINSVQGIVISFIVAKLVINGQLTFGAMLAVQYIIGQLSGPIQQWVSFVQSAQDAKISMERLNEIHQLDNEDPDDGDKHINHLPDNKSIVINNLTFAYPGAGNEPVLKSIDLVIPENKVTAIVGASGSGKTTLIKLLLKAYDQYDGEIRLGAEDFKRNSGLKFDYISHTYWRSICGAVLQDGYIFNDSIAKNIAVGSEEVDYKFLLRSAQVANIHGFIESLPNGYYTKLGAEGTGLSQGQKQRILIARAIYKDPEYLFFDEATNALDAHNEREIVENLNLFFKGKTVIVVAHRLSTVKNADNIVVLDEGRIVEEGTHDDLTQLKGKYYTLVKNQLELGN